MKRHPDLRGLSDDHHTALVVARRCQRAVAGELGGLAQALGEAMRTHFEPHFVIEEELLLPALEALGESDMARRLRAEHITLRRLAVAAPMTLSTLREFGETLARHVRYEERSVFASLQERLPRPVLAAIAARTDARPRSCPAALMSAPD